MTKGQVCDMSGLSYDRLRQGPVQWPYPCADPLTKEEENEPKRLYTDWRFPTEDGRAKFAAFHAKGLAEPPDSDYPMVLTTGRLYGHWHTQTRTGRIQKTSKMHPQPFLEIHPRDAKKLGIADGDRARVRSRRGMVELVAKVTRAIAPGTVFVPMHWGFLWADNAEANALTHAESCPISLQPELKACAVHVQRVEIDRPAQETTRSLVLQT